MLAADRGRLVRLIVFGLAAVFAVGYGFLFHSAPAAGMRLKHYGYYVMLATFLWWIWAISKVTRLELGRPTWSQINRCWRRHARAIGLIFGLTLVACLAVPYTYKVLYDEAVLQSTAFNLHFFRELGTVFRGYEVEGVFLPLTVYVDKRPFFYAFVVSLIHDLTGHRPLNAHVFNTALLPIVLTLFYYVGLRVGRQIGGVVGLTCFGASSLLAQNANGAGMEMLNLVMLLLTLGLAIAYLHRPDEPRLGAMVLSCVLLAQTRYESVLYVLPAAFVVWEGWRRAGRIILPPAAIAAPLLLIPAALQHTYLSGTPLLWELRDDVSARFGVENVGENLQHAWTFLFDMSGRLLNAWWLSVVGLAAVGWALWSIGRNWRMASRVREASVAIVLFALTVVANLALLMSYFWGQLDDPIVSRLVLPFHVVLGLAIAWAIGRLRASLRKPAARWIVAGALLTYIAFGLPAVSHHNYINQLAYEMIWEERWVARRPEMPRLIITNKTSLNWIALRIPALAVGFANNGIDRLRFHWRSGTFREVLVFQYYRPTDPGGGFILDPKDKLDDAIILEPLHERQFGGRLLRVSRVMEIRESATGS